jgi:hypothetical protein
MRPEGSPTLVIALEEDSRRRHAGPRAGRGPADMGAVPGRQGAFVVARRSSEDASNGAPQQLMSHKCTC